MIVYIYNIDVDLYNGFNGLRHRINWTYFTVLDGLAHPLYSIGQCARQLKIRSKVFWGVFSACSYIFFDFQDNKYTVLLKYKIITVHLCSSFRYKCLLGLYE